MNRFAPLTQAGPAAPGAISCGLVVDPNDHPVAVFDEGYIFSEGQSVRAPKNDNEAFGVDVLWAIVAMEGIDNLGEAILSVKACLSDIDGSKLNRLIAILQSVNGD